MCEYLLGTGTGDAEEKSKAPFPLKFTCQWGKTGNKKQASKYIVCQMVGRPLENNAHKEDTSVRGALVATIGFSEGGKTWAEICRGEG